MSKVAEASEMMMVRMEEICPPTLIDDCSVEELVSDVNVAFKIVGYTPVNLNKCVNQALEKVHHKGDLWKLCYHAWRLDL